MSIKRLTCPGCGQSVNVPASMAKAQCPGCGQVFSTTQPVASPAKRVAPSPAAAKGQRDGATSADESKMLQWVLVLGVCFVAMGVLIVLTYFRVSGEKEQSKQAAEVAAAAEAKAEEEARRNIEYRVVDLPESTRMKIYRDYTAMTDSMGRNSKKVPSSGAAGKAFNQLMQTTADREVTHFALNHNISEEDVMQIVLEGQANDW
ncbi:zinc ribbon domain-containing protein [Roseiconus lacunae]|uniref:hypothetical protein n=1 Tax=Roseiconus lacunae TaxID=2605694 RepID=UPI0011F2069D|nr:hypothetical protein [Roseiconus lacunae]